MKHITSKHIQMFVAGALAFIGLHALILLPHYLAASQSVALIFGYIFTSIGLLIGIAMLFGSARVFWWAAVYLLLAITDGLVPVFFAVFHPWSVRAHLGWWNVSDLLTPTLLLALLVWSRFMRSRENRTPNTALEPTPTAP
jgi:Ca2+/Na+ antiporter